jgi:ubiquinone/menaquinone biosynthesis C-methylase UbiE
MEKTQTRELWASGDYDAIAELIWAVGERIVSRVDIEPGQEVLDVACGTGNAALRAAAAGGRVTGVDITPELFVRGRERAAAAGVEVEWIEGDAEELPFEDESFDVVLSVFGCMFAPRQEVAARELVRVLRPGGSIGLCNWRPDGGAGAFFRTIGAHLPPPPEPFAPPALWGDETHVRRLLDGCGIALEFDHEEVLFESESAEQFVDHYARKFGPVVKAREALEAEGRWDALRSDLIELFEGLNVSLNGGLAWRGEYLVVLGTKALGS